MAALLSTAPLCFSTGFDFCAGFAAGEGHPAPVRSIRTRS